MRMPHRNLSPATLSGTYGHYLLIRLEAEPEVAHILEFFRSVRAANLEANEAYETAVVERRAALVRRDVRAEWMDDEIRNLAFAVLGRVRSHRNAPHFRHYFPDGHRQVLKMPLGERRRQCVVLLQKLELEEDEAIRSRMEPFRARFLELEKAIDELEAARDGEATRREQREAAKRAWLRGYRRAFLMLQDHYAEHPRVAENFFRRDHAEPSEREPEVVAESAEGNAGPED